MLFQNAYPANFFMPVVAPAIEEAVAAEEEDCKKEEEEEVSVGSNVAAGGDGEGRG